MAVTPRLDVVDGAGRRSVDVSPVPFAIGRRDTNHLQLGGSEVSRDHAEIVMEGARYLLRDKHSRFGTFVNGDAVTTERLLKPGDVIRLGRTGGAELVFQVGSPHPPGRRRRRSTSRWSRDRPPARSATCATSPASSRACGRSAPAACSTTCWRWSSTRPSTSAAPSAASSCSPATTAPSSSRWAAAAASSSWRAAPSRPAARFPKRSSRPANARLIADLLDGELANVHMGTVALGIRHVLCVPLDVVRYVEDATAIGPIASRRIGVLYLDSRERGALLAASTRGALETLAAEASLAIENARLYRSALEKAKLEQDIRIAAEIQQALLPKPRHGGAFFETAATTIPCRSIGGDFYDVMDLTGDVLGFALGDVAGKGPPAALLSALLQGIIAAQTASSDGPSATLARVNKAMIRRAVAARYATMFYAELHADGRLVYGNAGHNPPIVIGPGGVRRLEAGGPPVGLFDGHLLRFGRGPAAAGRSRHRLQRRRLGGLQHLGRGVQRRPHHRGRLRAGGPVTGRARRGADRRGALVHRRGAAGRRHHRPGRRLPSAGRRMIPWRAARGPAIVALVAAILDLEPRSSTCGSARPSASICGRRPRTRWARRATSRSTGRWRWRCVKARGSRPRGPRSSSRSILLAAWLGYRAGRQR